MTTADDAELLRRYWETKSQEAFAELVRRHVDGIYSSVLRRVGGDAHLAEDVTQRVFARLALKAGKLVGHPYPTAWLYQCARIESANLVRSERRRKAREETAAMSRDEHEEEAQIDWTRLSPVIDEAIDQLNERDRTAVLLRFIDRRGYAEIGRTLAVTEDAARMRVERALERLQAGLARRGVTSTSTAAALALVMSQHAVFAAPQGVAPAVVLSATMAGSGTSSLGGSLTAFMTLQKTTTLTLAGLALLASLGTAYWANERRVAANRALDATVTEGKTQEVELASLNQRVTAKAVEVSQYERDLAAAKAAKALAKSATWDPVAEGEAFLQRHPEMLQALNDQDDAGARFRYRRILQALPPDRAQKFLAALRGSTVHGLAGGPSGEIMMLRASAPFSPEDRTTNVQEILGESLFADFRKIGSQAWTQQIVSRLAASMVFSESPMSAAQTQALQETLAAVPRKTLEGSNIRAVDWDTSLAKTAVLLDAAQQAQLRAQAEREIASRASTLRLNRAIAGPNDAGAKRP